MTVTPDGQQLQRYRRRRRRDVDSADGAVNVEGHKSPVMDEDVSAFLQLEAEAKKLSEHRRECPVPKPGGILGELLGFKTGGNERHQGQVPQSDVSS